MLSSTLDRRDYRGINNPNNPHTSRYRGGTFHAWRGSGFHAERRTRNGELMPIAKAAYMNRREWRTFFAGIRRARKVKLFKRKYR